MRPVEFFEQTTIYAKDQPQYKPLPAHVDTDGTMTCCWRLTFKERLRILFTGVIWQQVLTFNKPLQPQLLLAWKPDFETVRAIGSASVADR